MTTALSFTNVGAYTQHAILMHLIASIIFFVQRDLLTAIGAHLQDIL